MADPLTPDQETDDKLEGETIEIDGEPIPEVEDTEDGGAIVRLEEKLSPDSDPDFLKNLAETLPRQELSTIASDLIDLVERDKEARKKRVEQYEMGIRRTGLGDDAPGGAQFEGASKVVHPMITEVCVDFSARAMKELFPPDGPAKDSIPGTVTPEKVTKARRKTRFMNWQLTIQSPSFRSELEQLLTQVPLGGAAYMKVTWDDRRNRPGFTFIPIDDILLPYAATNFYAAQRRTHVQYLTAQTYAAKVRAEVYRDVDLSPPSMLPEQTRAAKANDKVEGRTDNAYNEDGLRTVYEIYTTLELSTDDDEPSPYIVTLDEITREVLAIYRNWDEDDDSREELEWIVEFPFVPWRGAYPIGIIHMIGGLSAAATGALRALLDSAHIQNSQTLLKLKGGSKGGQSLEIQPTQVLEIEGSLTADDIRKTIMALPYNPPSQTLFQLLGFVVDAGKGLVQTTMEAPTDANPNVPVGTTLANIEQGMVVYSSIHARLHNAVFRLLTILHRLNGMYLDDQEEVEQLGEDIATRLDFEGPMDVVPVSDPNIFSEAQRFAQVQAVASRAQLNPNLYNQRKVEERILETLKIPYPKDLLNPPVEPQEQNAVAENVAMTLAHPVVAFPEQDHIAHLKTHLAYMVSPALGFSRLIAPSFLPGVLGHIKEHIALWYAAEVLSVGSDAVGFDLGEAAKVNKEPEAKREFDRLLAEASQTVAGGAAEVFAKLPPVIAQAIQMLQQLQPQPQGDPAMMAETLRKAQADLQKQQTAAAKVQVDQAQLAVAQQKGSAEVAVRQAELQVDAAQLAADEREAQARLASDQAIVLTQERAEDARDAADQQVKTNINDQDNATALELAKLELAAGHNRFPVKDGTGINPS